MHRKVATALVAAFALGVSSCGDSGGEPLARAELVRRIEQACRAGQREGQRVMRSAGSRDDGGKFVAAVTRSTSVVVDRLGELEPVAEVEDTFNAFKDAMEEREELLAGLEGMRGPELRRAIRAVEDEAAENGERVAAAARRLGVEGCI